MKPRILDLGDRALTVEFGDRIDAALQARVAALDQACAVAMQAGRLPGVSETVPSFRSLTLIFDPLLTSRARLLPALQELLDSPGSQTPAPARHWQLPACYEADFAPDLGDIAAHSGLTETAVIEQHLATEYRVYMLGFLPGFPFMGDIAPPLRLPRRAEPRVQVPAGSVAIANGLTAIYPWQSPGGWHLLANCPVPLFDATRGSPALLGAGDRVRFKAVNAAEHARLSRALSAGELSPDSFARPAP